MPSEALFPARHERARCAVLIVDLVESGRLIEQDEEGAISRWLRLVEYIEQHVLPACGGRLVKSLGDGMLLEFPNSRAAVSAAFAAQHASHRESRSLPEGSGPRTL